MHCVINPTQFKCPKIVSFDTEYTELNIRKATLLSISISVSKDLTYIFEPSHFSYAEELLDAAGIIFTWNGVVDWYMYTKSVARLHKDKIIDAMLLEHLIDERLDHGLGDFALREYNDNYKKEFWSKYGSYQEASKEDAWEYEKRDGIYTYRAGTKYLEHLSGKMGLVEHVHRLQWALFSTEIAGLKVNVDLMRKTKDEMSAKIAEYLPKLRSEFNEHCNLWELKKWQTEISKRKSVEGRRRVVRPTFSFTSDKQVGELVYGEPFLGLPVNSKTKKGSPSTSFDSLKELAKSCPEISTLVEYKEVKGVYATFVEGMLERVEEDRIYPHFNINGTATGRISHTNPNMGNLPTDGIIRNFFIPDTGNVLIGADYSQLEVVVEANLTNDPQLLKIINEGASKHDITANGLGITRDQAKTLNFALQYGAGVFKVSKILSISNSAAQDIFDRYWQLYAGVKSLKDQTCETLAKTGEVTNIFGRTRHFDKPKNEFEKAKQERQAYNHLVQGPGADITNRATYLISDFFNQEKIGRLLFSVHDEILCEVRKDMAECAKEIIVERMGSVNEFTRFKFPVRAKSYGPLTCWAKT